MKPEHEIRGAQALLSAALDLAIPESVLEQLLVSLDTLRWVMGERETVLGLNLRNLATLAEPTTGWKQ